MPLRVGAPAEGDDFFNRDIERAQIWRVLVDNHVVLAAPRRLGKTSLLKQLVQTAPEHGLMAQYLDVSHHSDTAELLKSIDLAFSEASIQAHLKRFSLAVSGWFARLGKVRIDAGELGGIELETRPTATAGWPEQAQRLRARLSPQPVLIVLDEFSVFLQRLLQHDRDQAIHLLAVLRAWRQHTGLACRFVLSGSIGLNRLLERHGLQAETNDCYDFPLPPFARPDALAMLQHFGQREGWLLDEAHATTICDRVGWLSPFYLLLALEECIQAAMRRLRVRAGNDEPMGAADIDAAFAQLLAARSRFVHWHQRLPEHIAPTELAFARNSLARLCTRPQGLLETTLLSHPDQRPAQADALLLLEEHGYLVRDGQRLMFQSPLLRQYWKKHHGA